MVQDLILQALNSLNIKQNEEHFDSEVKLKYRKLIFQYVKQQLNEKRDCSIMDTEINRLISLNYRMFIIKNFKVQFSLLDSYKYIYHYLNSSNEEQIKEKCSQLQNYLSKRTWKRRVQEAKKILEKNNLCKGFKNCNDKIDNSMDEYIQENSTYSTDLSENNQLYQQPQSNFIEEDNNNQQIVFSSFLDFSWDNIENNNNNNSYNSSYFNLEDEEPQNLDFNNNQVFQQNYSMSLEEFLNHIKHNKREKLEYETKVEALQYLIENDIKEINIDSLIKLIEQKFYKDYSNKKQSYIRSQLYKFFSIEEGQQQQKIQNNEKKKRRQLIDQQIVIYPRQFSEIDIDIYFN